MKKRFSIHHFLIGLLLFSLMIPGFAGATANGNGSNSEGPTGKLTIHKFEQEEGTERGDGDGSELNPQPEGDALPGVEFTLTQTHSYDPTTDKWTELGDGEGKTYTEETGSDGKIVIDNIDLGRYTVQETDGPDHVVLNTQEYSVDIPMTSKDGSNVNYDVHIYPKNDTVRGSVTLTKYDGDTCSEVDPGPAPQSSNGSSVECEVLEGVTFDLYNEDDEKVNEEPLITDANGKINVDGLAYGEYYFVETATIDGYLINGKKVVFSITEQGQEVEVGLDNYKKPEVEKEVNHDAVNRGEIVTYTITVDLPGDINDYNSFTIIDELDINLEYVDGSEESPDGFSFTQNGQTLTWEKTGNLIPGEVSVTFQAKVSENAAANEVINNEARIVYHNGYEAGGDKTPEVPVLPTAGLLKVLKQDGDSKEALPGATFELHDSDGNKVSSGTTGPNGILDFGELDYGTYTLYETKAPNGYNKLRNPIEVNVNEDNNEQTITVDNYASDWQLPKTGGIGTMLFTLAGLTLMAGSLFMYIRRRKGEIA